MRAPGNVGEGLVDGDALDGRREIAQDSDGGVAEPLVFVEMSADEHEVGTELPRASSRHAASYAEGSRFVGGRENDAAADRNRLAAQARVEQLLDRRIKGVEVRVENGGLSTPRLTPTTAQTRAATRRVPVRLPGAAPPERQLQSSASAP